MLEIKAYSKQGHVGKDHLHIVIEVEIRTEAQYYEQIPRYCKKVYEP
jgi:hypothetical protein